MITVILVEPQNPGNIGAIARSMKNFNLKNLVLINPKCNHLSEESLKRAKHAKDILKKVKIKKSIDFKSYNLVIGTSAIVGTDYNIPRSPLTIDKIKIIKKTALLFGRESSGLTNQEIKKCDFIITIPTSNKYPTMNIAQAATVLFYEIFKKSKEQKTNSHIHFATNKEKEHLLKLINKKLDILKFSTKEKKETQKKLWKRVVNKAYLTRRELFALHGFFKKIN